MCVGNLGVQDGDKAHCLREGEEYPGDVSIPGGK
jgi:hypothetical protein